MNEAKEFINPNWHVILIHYPLGVFVLGMVIELLSFLYRRSTFRTAGRWMILAGALLGIPAAFTGIYALADVTRRSLPAEEYPGQYEGLAEAGRWYELSAATSETLPWEMLESHAWLQGASTVLSVLLVVIALGCSDLWRRRLYVPILLGLVASLGLMVAGAYYGGEMVYREGVAVQRGYHEVDESAEEAETESEAATTRSTVTTGTSTEDAIGVENGTDDETGGDAEPVAAEEQTEKQRGLEYFVPPLQTHVTLAGFAVALGMLSIGLAARAMTRANEYPGSDVGAARELLDMETRRPASPPVPQPGPPRRGTGADDLTVARSLRPGASVSAISSADEPPVIPAARFWLLTALASIAAALAGWWVLAGDSDLGWNPRLLWQQVMQETTTRRLAHVVLSGGIIILPLILAALARWAVRRRVLLAVFSVLLVATVAAQVWVGILLLYDQPDSDPDLGPWYRFQRDESAAVSE